MKTALEIKKEKEIDPSEIKKEYQDFILAEDHPCIMAQTVFSMDDVHFMVGEKMNSEATTKKLYERIKAYVAAYDFESNDFQSLIAVFPQDHFVTETAFEEALWNQLQALHDIDDVSWDPEVSQDPEDSNFSFSIAGKAFYIVGMHPESSRLARSTPYPTMVFNLHWQFEKLREMGSFTMIRDRIRERDIELQNSINPTLKDFGNDSEAKQYSGRQIEAHWKCPFLNKNL